MVNVKASYIAMGLFILESGKDWSSCSECLICCSEWVNPGVNCKPRVSMRRQWVWQSISIWQPWNRKRLRRFLSERTLTLITFTDLPFFLISLWFELLYCIPLYWCLSLMYRRKKTRWPWAHSEWPRHWARLTVMIQKIVLNRCCVSTH